MSEFALRIEWKHFRKPAGPASGRNCPLKSRNLGFCHHGTFFRSCEKIEKWEIEKKCWHGRAKFFWADGRDLGSIGGQAAALSPETVLVPDANLTCGRFPPLDIPFSTLRFLDCRALGFAPRNEGRWSWVTVRLYGTQERFGGTPRYLE